jgi:hypothetical protein
MSFSESFFHDLSGMSWWSPSKVILMVQIAGVFQCFSYVFMASRVYTCTVIGGFKDCF